MRNYYSFTISVILLSISSFFVNYATSQIYDCLRKTPTFYYENINSQVEREQIKNDISFVPIYFQDNKKSEKRLSFSDDELFTLTVNTNFDMGMIWIYNSQIDTFNNRVNYQFTVNLPQGIYNILTAYRPFQNQSTVIVRDSIVLNAPTIVNIDKQEAAHTCFYQFTRENGAPLHINAFVGYLIHEVLRKGVALYFVNINTKTMVVRYNHIPQYFIKDWAVKGKQNDNGGNLYLLNNEAFYPQSDTIINNDPQNYAHAEFHYHFPDSIAVQTPVQVGTMFPIFHYFLNDPNLNHPVTINIYQDTSATIDRYNSIFKQIVNIITIPGIDLVTSEIRIGDNYVKGFITPDWYHSPLPLSINNIVHIGRPPTFWFGKFENAQDTIKIRGLFGRFNNHQLFLSMTNDVLKHFPIEYSIYKGCELLKSGSWNPIWGIYGLIFGFNPDSMTFSMVSGKYEMEIIDNKSEIAGYPATTAVKVGFDLNKSDKNPPNMVLFQIISNNEITNILEPNGINKIRFIVEDNNEIGDVELYYSVYPDTVWTPLLLNYNQPFYITQLPFLSPNYYSLKIVAIDSAQNYLKSLMEPAFHIGEVNAIVNNNSKNTVQDFSLYSNYPNPFNSETSIPFTIPANYGEKISISIYNILGQRISTLFEGFVEAGFHEIRWGGQNDFGSIASSGIYILQMKGGETVKKRKLLLVR